MAVKEPITCPHCGARLTADEKFCPDCGANLKIIKEKTKAKKQSPAGTGRKQKEKKKPDIILIVLITLLLIIVGLLINEGYLKPLKESKQFQELVKSFPEVKEFLDIYPNATLSAKEYAWEESLKLIQAQCEPGILGQPLWRVEVVEGSHKAIIFLDETNHPVCVLELWKCDCAPTERCENFECKTYCGNRQCDPEEDCTNCSDDCATSHDHMRCKDDAVHWFDSCGRAEEIVDLCSTDEECINSRCRPKCGNGVCGSDENCELCPADCGCDQYEHCEKGECTVYCGNGQCDSDENCETCVIDCGCSKYRQCVDKRCKSWCGNGQCDSDEGCETCPDDCSCSGEAKCENNGCIIPIRTSNEVLQVGETKTYTIGSKDYEVTLSYTDGRYAKFTVTGVSTSMIAVGGADVLADGSEIGVVKITYQPYAGGIQSVEFYLLASP